MKLGKFFGYFSKMVAADLPPIDTPKVPRKQQTLPGYRTQRAAGTASIRRDDLRLANANLLDFRTGRDTATVVRNLSKSSPDFAAAISTYLRVGIPEDFTVICRNMDGSINPEGTDLTHQILRRFTYVPDYSLGFNAYGSLQSISESLSRELLQYGALAGEVVLDRTMLPTQVVPVSTTNIKFYEEDNGLRPVQDIGGSETDLDIPTFIYISVDQDLLNAYSSSYLEAAIQPVLADAEFTNDLRRVLKRAIHPRIVAKIVEETVRDNLPPEILNDPDRYAAEINSIVAAVENVINGLSPEDALVGMDSVEYAYMEGQAQDLSGLYEAVQKLINAKVSTGAKTMPAVLGHNSSANAASAETMLYLKHADLVRRKLNEFWSRALTISARLFGMDVYVDFEFARLDLRPQGELEAYKSMEQSRILEQLSLGLISDEEACVKLTGKLPPKGFKPLAGTMFKGGASPNIENPQSGTSVMNKTLKPDTPASPKSDKTNSTKAEVYKLGVK
jgi:hypothetical protein